MIAPKRFWTVSFLAWFIFIGIDFLFHASLLESLWKEDLAAFKSAKDLFVLIPAGYGSFFLLTVLTGYIFTRIFPRKPNSSKTLNFTLIFGGLFSVNFLLSLYSFVDIPLKHLIAFSLVYFIEIVAVIFVFYKTSYKHSIRKNTWYAILAFFLFIILGIVTQNVL